MATVISLVNGIVDRAIKAQRKIPKNSMNPDGRTLRRYEREGADRLASALNRLRIALFRGIGADDLHRLVGRLSDPAIIQPLKDELMALVQEWAIAGGEFGQQQIESEVFGVRKAAHDFDINWELVNVDAVEWARQHTGELVKGITETTAERLRREVAGFAESGETMQQFERRLAASGIFSPTRARMIAVTEVTMAFARGNMIAWQRSGVTEGKEWNTAMDELVCPICGPLNTKVVPLDGKFDGGYESPPAHPRCRCWLTPVVEGDVEKVGQFSAADEIAFLERITAGADILENVRPPAGRAPRGMGEEYAIRRRIASRIDTQMKFRGQIDRTLSQYRGQQNVSWQIAEMRHRKQELDQAIEAAVEVATMPAGDWGFKMELVDGIIDFLQMMTTKKAFELWE